MAANIATFSDGRKRMAGAKRLPIWWETQSDRAQRSEGELLKLDEAYELGGVDIPIETTPALYRDPRDGQVRAGKGVQIVRGDNGEALGHASDDYKVVQNREVFELLRQHLDAGSLKGVLSCGVLGNGEKAWMQAVFGEISVSPVDRADTTLLITTDHTARGAAKVGFNSQWVVCENTEQLAQRQWDKTGNVMKLVHFGDTKLGLAVINQSLDLAEKKFRQWESIARRLAGVKLDQEIKETRRLAIASMLPPLKTLEAWQKNADKPRGYWQGVYEGVMTEYVDGPGMDLDSRRATAWGSLNAITGYVDHGRSKSQSAESRLSQAWYGEGNEIKNRAGDAAVAHFLDGKPWDEQVLEVERLLAIA